MQSLSLHSGEVSDFPARKFILKEDAKPNYCLA